MLLNTRVHTIVALVRMHLFQYGQLSPRQRQGKEGVLGHDRKDICKVSPALLLQCRSYVVVKIMYSG